MLQKTLIVDVQADQAFSLRAFIRRNLDVLRSMRSWGFKTSYIVSRLSEVVGKPIQVKAFLTEMKAVEGEAPGKQDLLDAEVVWAFLYNSPEAVHLIGKPNLNSEVLVNADDQNGCKKASLKVFVDQHYDEIRSSIDSGVSYIEMAALIKKKYGLLFNPTSIRDYMSRSKKAKSKE